MKRRRYVVVNFNSHEQNPNGTDVRWSVTIDEKKAHAFARQVAKRWPGTTFEIFTQEQNP